MDQWTNGPMDNRPMDHWANWPTDQWTNGTLDHWNIGTLEHWNIGILEHSTFNQHLVTSIALILFKRLRVTLVTSIASRDWVKIWKSCCRADIYIIDHHQQSSCQSFKKTTNVMNKQVQHILHGPEDKVISEDWQHWQGASLAPSSPGKWKAHQMPDFCPG